MMDFNFTPKPKLSKPDSVICQADASKCSFPECACPIKDPELIPSGAMDQAAPTSQCKTHGQFTRDLIAIAGSSEGFISVADVIRLSKMGVRPEGAVLPSPVPSLDAAMAKAHDDMAEAELKATQALDRLDTAMTIHDLEARNHPLFPVFMAAIHQAMHGKGQRHGGGITPFLDQPIFHYEHMHGRGFLTGQAAKKLEEAASTRHGQSFIDESLGALVYIGAAIIKEPK